MGTFPPGGQTPATGDKEERSGAERRSCGGRADSPFVSSRPPRVLCSAAVEAERSEKYIPTPPTLPSPNPPPPPPTKSVV